MKILRFCVSGVFLLCLSTGSHAQDAAAVFEKVRHAVFMVIVTTDDPGVVDVVAQGSAILIAPGRLVTNCHVVERGATIFISRREDKLTERARIASRHAPTDLCELDVIRPGQAFAKPVEIAPSGELKVGDPVYAIGSPRGMELTISDGIVSAFREARGDIQVIQTTAPFSPGSSGGGLFDRAGRLVGITTLILKDAQNINFAVSSRYVRGASLSEAELLKQRNAAAAAELQPPRESAYERNERLRREEQKIIESRRKQLESDMRSPAIATPPPAAPQARRRTPQELAAFWVPYENTRDARPAKRYEQLVRSGTLSGLPDDEVVRAVYGSLIREDVAAQLRWKEGARTAQFDLELRRNGELMFILRGKSSGLDSFDREAERAIGVASPFPVPQDNSAFEMVRRMRIEVVKK